ncbi:FYVE zinc finger-domain-containing protein [Choanephora cucurbitarum]|nr:FYVE zinc finger-domain-containing protein [Choanephora cucurbitarum]
MTDTQTSLSEIPAEEADITETLPHGHHSPLQENLSVNQVSSESEEDVTEERIIQPVHLPRSQRVWEMDRQAPECRRCHRRFNFLVRRHHCRRCGQIVCDRCSSNRLKLPVEELVEDPMISLSQYPYLATQTQRVCDSCYREPIVDHRRRTRSTVPTDMRRTNSAQSLMIDCPVCGRTFLGMQKYQQEAHLQQCLNIGSPPVQSPRYIVYELSSDSAQIGDECPICFDEFEQGKDI